MAYGDTCTDKDILDTVRAGVGVVVLLPLLLLLLVLPLKLVLVVLLDVRHPRRPCPRVRFRYWPDSNGCCKKRKESNDDNTILIVMPAQT